MTKRVNKFNHSKRLVLAVVVGISAIGLVGCGDGGSGALGVGGQGAAASAQINFKVENTSGADVKSVRIMSAQGKELAGGSMNCATNATCEFQGAMKEPGILQFYDKKDTLVGAYVLTEAPQGYQYVKTSGYMLGLFLFNELRNRYPERPEALLSKINILFENYTSADGLPDKFQELGQYYRYRMIGTGLKDEEFFKDLHQKLDAAEPLPPKLFKVSHHSFWQQAEALVGNLDVISSAHAAAPSGGCPDTLNGLVTIANGLGNLVPGIGFLGGIVNAGCDAAQPEDKRLDEISDKLDKLQTNLDSMNLGLEKLISFVATEASNRVLSNTNKDILDADRHMADYQNLIYGKGSFMAFVGSYGSFEKAWKNNKSKMDNLLLNFSDDWNNLQKVGEPFQKSSLANALNSLCEEKESLSIDIVDNRKKCNAAIVYYQSRVISTYVKHLAMLKDVTETLQKYSATEKKFIEKVTKPGTTTKGSWAEQYQQVMLPVLQNALKTASDNFVVDSRYSLANTNNTYYDRFAGLPKPLLARFQEPGLKNTCTEGSSIGRQTTPIPNITSWINNGANSYITAVCKDSQTSKNRFTSRYYLSSGNEPINLMGVLVPSAEEFFYANDNFMYIPGRRTAVDNGWINIPSDWATYTADNDLRTIVQQTGSLNIEAGAQSNNVRFGVRPNSGGNKVFYTHISGYPECNNCGGSISRVYMRKTDASTGLSSIGAIYAARYMRDTMRFQMNCVNDKQGCVADTGAQHALTFKNGIKIESTYTYDSGFSSKDTINASFK